MRPYCIENVDATHVPRQFVFEMQITVKCTSQQCCRDVMFLGVLKRSMVHSRLIKISGHNYAKVCVNLGCLPSFDKVVCYYLYSERYNHLNYCHRSIKSIERTCKNTKLKGREYHIIIQLWEDKDSCHLVCCTVSFGDRLPEFQRIIVPSCSRVRQFFLDCLIV
jgi:hypothetical protein